MKIYCLSGLGSDEKAFQSLHLNGHEMICLEWIRPKENESLEAYAYRMKDQITPGQKFSLIGLSFGGMVGIEISKIFRPEKFILISGVVTRNELPFLYRIGRITHSVNFIPRLMERSGLFLKYLFGTVTKPENEMLRKIIRETDRNFLMWALKASLNWKNDQEIKCIRIHGTKDRIFPFRNLKIDYPIRKGGHFMIINRGDEISQIIEKELEPSWV